MSEVVEHRGTKMKVNCKCCEVIKEKSFTEVITDFIKPGRRPFLCKDCNENRIWEKNKIPSYGKNNYFNYQECIVTPLNYHIKEFVNTIAGDQNLLCEIHYKDGSTQMVFPDKYENMYIYACGDDWSEGVVDQAHQRNDMKLIIPIYKIDKMLSVDIFRDYIESDPPEPMYGYKAMLVENGIIEKGYQLGVTKEEPKRPNPYKTDYQDCYKHYCKSMEEPLLEWGRDYIEGTIDRDSYASYHLYRIKAEGHYRQNTKYGWVANKLTLIEEVSKQEIIAYFEQNPGLLQKLKDYWKKEGKPQGYWELYKSS